MLSLFAAEQGIIRNPWDRLDGAEFMAAVDAAREAGAEIPEYVKEDDDAGPVAALALDQLAALDPQERARAARKRGFD